MGVSRESQFFCSNIRFLRKKYHLSKKSMAMLVGISLRSLGLIESGIMPDRVTADALIRLHRVFDLSVDALIWSLLEECDEQQ